MQQPRHKAVAPHGVVPAPVGYRPEFATVGLDEHRPHRFLRSIDAFAFIIGLFLGVALTLLLLRARGTDEVALLACSKREPARG